LPVAGEGRFQVTVLARTFPPPFSAIGTIGTLGTAGVVHGSVHVT
jgi:hypothetical protein